MDKLKKLFLVAALLQAVIPLVGQTHIYPAQDTNNIFAGQNTFNNTVTFGHVWSFSSGSVSNQSISTLFAGLGCTSGQVFVPASNACSTIGISGVPAGPAFAVNFANNGVTALQGDSTILINPTTHSFTAPVVNSVRDAVANATGTTDGGFIETYSGCPSNGCKIILSADITINQATTLTLTNGKPLIFDPQGHNIFMTCSTSPCLKIDATSAQRQQFVWTTGTIDGSGAIGAIVGVQILNAQDQWIGPLHFKNFYNTGQTALELNNVEDSTVSVTTEQCFNGVHADNATNNNNLTFYLNDGGATSGISSALTGIALFLDGSGGNRIHGLIQSNKETVAVLINGQSDFNEFDSVWWENNGDGTGNSRLVKFDSASAFIVQTSFLTNFISAGSLGMLGDEFTTTNVGQLFGINFFGGYHIQYSAWADATFGTATPFNLWGEDVVTTGGATNTGFYCSGSVGCTLPGTIFNGNTSISGANSLTLGTGAFNTSGSILQSGGASGIQVGGGGIVMNGNLSGVGTTWTSNGLSTGTQEIHEYVLPVSGVGSGAPYNWLLYDVLNSHTIFTCNQATAGTEVCAFDGHITTPQINATTAAFVTASSTGAVNFNSATIGTATISAAGAAAVSSLTIGGVNATVQSGGTETAGQLACIKAVGPPLVIGTCTAVSGATCTTCN